MASEVQSVETEDAPSSDVVESEGFVETEDASSELEVDGGLLSSTPSSVPFQGPLVGQLDQLMTVIQTYRKENNDLRNQLSNQNMTIQHKSKNLEQISENYRLYDETLKKKYQETAQKFKALREENKTLKDEINNLKQGKTTEKNGEHLKEEEGGNSLQSWITINVETESQQKEHSTADYRKLKSQLNAEQEKTAEVTGELQKTKATKETLEAKLTTATNEISKMKDEKKKEIQDLRTSLGKELNGYKKQVDSLITELAECKRNLVLHGRKVQELHDANLQFDEVNSAYHSKLAMYEEELKKRDVYNEQMKLQFRQVNQTLAAERQEKEDLESKNSRVQEALRLANKQSVDSRREQDSLTARIVSMEESLDIRNNKLKAAEDSIQLLRAQLNQYQHDFGNERIAREQIHQESQEKGLKLENLRKENDELKNMVQKYTEAQMQRLSSQYSNPNTTSPVSPTSPYHHGTGLYGGGGGGLGGGLGGVGGGGGGQTYNYRGGEHPSMGSYSRGQVQPMNTEESQQQQHQCPVCPEFFWEAESLRIHCNSHFDN